MKFLFILIILLLNFFNAKSDTLSVITLKSCYEKAYKNYPLSKQKEINSNLKELKIQNLKTGYLPVINLNGQVSYQSDVPHMIIPPPTVNSAGFPAGIAPTITMGEVTPPDKDQYKVSVDVNQLIYDADSTSKLIKLEEFNSDIGQLSIDVELYRLKERVQQLFFSVLLLEQSKKLVETVKEELENKQRKVLANVKNGTTFAFNGELIRAEIIRMDQQLIEIEAKTDATTEMLEIILGENLPEESFFEEPEIDDPTRNLEIHRKDLELLTLQTDRAEASKVILENKLIPRFYFFGQLGYGKPGLNMLKSEFALFGIAGIKMVWNIWDWKVSQNEIEALNFQKEIYSSQKEVFLKNLEIALSKEFSEIEKYEKLLKKDEEIISIRSSIAKTYGVQLENGVITYTDYLSEINNETQAKLNMENHRLELLRAKINCRNLYGLE